MTSTSASVDAPASSRTVTRGGVFGRVLWRAALTCIGGGAAIGLVLGAAIGVSATEDSVGTRIAAPFLVAYFGAAFGILLAIVAAPVVAAIAAKTLVPYPGADAARRRIRVIGTSFVGAVAVLIVATIGEGWEFWAVIGVLAIAGAWFLSPLLVRWYIRRMESPAV